MVSSADARVLPIAFALLASVANAAEKTTKESLGSGGRTRTYSLFVPDSTRGQEAVPLVVLLHGSGRVGASLTEKWVSLAKKEGFIQKARLPGEPKYQRYQIAR